MAAQRIHLDRFSPMFDTADAFELVDITPFPSAGHIYREVPTSSLANLVYYFTYDYLDKRSVDDYVTSCAHGLANWKEVHSTSDLYALELREELQIWDLRPTVSQHVLMRLIGLERELYLACDAVQTIEYLRTIIEQHTGPISPDHARSLLQSFVDKGIMLMDGNSYLSLAVLITPLAAKYAVLANMERVLELTGKTPGYFQLTEGRDCLLQSHEILIAVD